MPLPITLISFTATAHDCNADLKWQTALEQNNYRYEIELSTDGSGFNKVGEMKSSNSSTGVKYSYQYKGLSSRITYFRLRSVDRDGIATYSPIASVSSNCIAGRKLVVSPNPAKDQVNIQGLENGNNDISLFDVNGKKLTGLVGPGVSQSLSVSSCPKGVYILRIISANGTVVNIKLIKE